MTYGGTPASAANLRRASRSASNRGSGGPSKRWRPVRLRGGGTAIASCCSPFRIALAPPLQNRLRPGPKAHPAIGICAKRVASDQRASGRPDERQLFFGRDPEYRQAMMPEAAHLLAILARQYVSEMADAEPHFGAERSRQQLARDLGRINRCRRVEAIVTIAAMLGRVLAEMPEQDRAAAGCRFDERGQCVQPLA